MVPRGRGCLRFVLRDTHPGARANACRSDIRSFADGTLTLLTPFDPLFLLISLLSSLPAQYLSCADLWDALSLLGFKSPSASKGSETKGEKCAEDESDGDRTMAEDIMRLGTLDCVKERLEAVCDKAGALRPPAPSCSHTELTAKISYRA